MQFSLTFFNGYCIFLFLLCGVIKEAKTAKLCKFL